MRHRFGQTDGPACPKPGYTRTLVSTGLFTLVWAPFALGGALIAATSDPKLKAALIAALKNQPASTTPPGASLSPAEKAAFEKTAAEVAGKVNMRRLVVGAVIGGAVGILPALYAQRAVLRTPECPRPGMGRLLVYDVFKVGAAAGAGYAGGALWPAHGRSVARSTAFFALPLAGMALLKDTKQAA